MLAAQSVARGLCSLSGPSQGSQLLGGEADEHSGESETRPGRGLATSSLRFVTLTSYNRRIVLADGKGVVLSAGICACAITRLPSISKKNDRRH